MGNKASTGYKADNRKDAPVPLSLAELVHRSRPSIVAAQVPDWCDRLSRHFAAEMQLALAAQSVRLMESVWERFDELPRTSTARAFREQGIALGEPLLTKHSKHAVLYDGVRGSIPLILKKLTADECIGYQLIAKLGESSPAQTHLAPFNLFDSSSPSSSALRNWASMPHYPTTLESFARPLAVAAADQLISHVSAALTVIHEKNLAHMDVKPGNIFVDMDGGFFLADFGCARVMGNSAPRTTATFVPRDVRESALLPHKASSLHDWWMLAMTVAEMTTKRGVGARATDFSSEQCWNLSTQQKPESSPTSSRNHLALLVPLQLTRFFLQSLLPWQSSRPSASLCARLQLSCRLRRQWIPALPSPILHLNFES